MWVSYSIDKNLCANSCSVLHLLRMPFCRAVFAYVFHSSYGRHFLDHLAADAAGLAAGQVAFAALLQVDANLFCRLDFGLDRESEHRVCFREPFYAASGLTICGDGQAIRHPAILRLCGDCLSQNSKIKAAQVGNLRRLYDRGLAYLFI